MDSPTLCCAQVRTSTSHHRSLICIKSMFLFSLSGRPEGGGHSCNGDSGAPLFRSVFDRSGTARAVLVGTNHGAPGQCGTFPSIYARIEDPSIYDYIKGPRGD